VESENIQEASLTKINEVKVWVQVLLDEGKIQEINFNENRDEFEKFSEVLIIMDENEYVWPFIELGMMVLVAHTQRSIDDIVEAFLFRELNELAY